MKRGLGSWCKDKSSVLAIDHTFTVCAADCLYVAGLEMNKYYAGAAESERNSITSYAHTVHSLAT